MAIDELVMDVFVDRVAGEMMVFQPYIPTLRYPNMRCFFLTRSCYSSLAKADICEQAEGRCPDVNVCLPAYECGTGVAH